MHSSALTMSYSGTWLKSQRAVPIRYNTHMHAQTCVRLSFRMFRVTHLFHFRMIWCCWGGRWEPSVWCVRGTLTASAPLSKNRWVWHRPRILSCIGDSWKMKCVCLCVAGLHYSLRCAPDLQLSDCGVGAGSFRAPGVHSRCIFRERTTQLHPRSRVCRPGRGQQHRWTTKKYKVDRRLFWSTLKWIWVYNSMYAVFVPEAWSAVDL